MLRFNPRVVHVKFVMEEVELEQLFLQPVQLSPAKQYSTNGLYHQGADTIGLCGARV